MDSQINSDPLNSIDDTGGGQQKINLEPERIFDADFMRICCFGCGFDQLGAMLNRFGCGERCPVLKEIIEKVLTRVDDFGKLERYIWMLQFAYGVVSAEGSSGVVVGADLPTYSTPRQVSDAACA